MSLNKSDRTIKGLTASSNLSEETGHPGKDIKPCVATLIETSLSKGDFPNRNSTAVIIASELNRIDVSYDDALTRLSYWNQYNKPPLKINELINAIQNGYTGKYNYGCKNAVLFSFCIEDLCPFKNHVNSSKKRIRNQVFLDYGWQRYLSNQQVLIYYVALPYLEIKRRVGYGGLVCANHKQVAESCGISDRRVGHNLTVLANIGLITYKVGFAQKWKGIASEIRRIIPIPRPTNRIIERLRKC